MGYFLFSNYHFQMGVNVMGFAEYFGQYLYSADENGNTNSKITHSHHLFCVGHSEEKKGRKKIKDCILKCSSHAHTQDILGIQLGASPFVNFHFVMGFAEHFGHNETWTLERQVE